MAVLQTTNQKSLQPSVANDVEEIAVVILHLLDNLYEVSDALLLLETASKQDVGLSSS